MSISTIEDILCGQTQATFSDIARDLENALWVRSTARQVNLFSEISIVEKLANIMEDFRKRYNWAAVSSNNIHWNLTEEPIRVIQIPDPDYSLTEAIQTNKYLTIINPTQKNLSDFSPKLGIEGCGSFGEPRIPVARNRAIFVTGFVLEKDTYDTILIDNPELTAYTEHEIDHLNGKTISDYGPVYYLSCSNDCLSEIKDNPMHIVSSTFEHVWPNESNQNGNGLIRIKELNRLVLLDKKGEPIPTLSFVLDHDKKNKPYWSIYNAPAWAITHVLPDTKYGQHIAFEFVDTPEFREILDDLPDMKSKYDFWNIPREMNYI